MNQSKLLVCNGVCDVCWSAPDFVGVGMAGGRACVFGAGEMEREREDRGLG